MKTTYNFLLSKNLKTGQYWADLLPVGDYGQAIEIGAENKMAVLDTTGSVYRFYSVNQNYIEEPLSAICFWLQYKGAMYGEIMSTGLKVKALLGDDLHKCTIGGGTVCLDITISETLFQNAEDISGETILDFEPWRLAKKQKAVKTSFLSLYNNHNFYTISDNENK